MCDRDHEPVATIGGVPVVICDDAPAGGYSIPGVIVDPTYLSQ